MKLKKKHGFTLLEIIIVIIIVGVLASLALPRLFKTVEFSRSGEALAAFSSIRSSLERCYLQRGANYFGCSGFGTTLDLEDPSNSPNAHFTYTVNTANAAGYTVTATRKTNDGGNVNDVIQIIQVTSVTKSGTGAFAGIN